MNAMKVSQTAALSNSLGAVTDVLNRGGAHDSEQESAAVRWFAREHRTLQQRFMKIVIMPILTYLAECHEQGFTDLRNSHSTMIASKMLKALDEGDEYIPFI